MWLTVVSNGITLKQTEAVISLVGRYLEPQDLMLCETQLVNEEKNKTWMWLSCPHLAQREVINKGRGTVRLSEGEGRGGAGDFDASTTVLGSDLGFEGPPVLRVCVDSLKYRKTSISLWLNVLNPSSYAISVHVSMIKLL